MGRPDRKQKSRGAAPLLFPGTTRAPGLTGREPSCRVGKRIEASHLGRATVAERLPRCQPPGALLVEGQVGPGALPASAARDLPPVLGPDTIRQYAACAPYDTTATIPRSSGAFGCHRAGATMRFGHPDVDHVSHRARNRRHAGLRGPWRRQFVPVVPQATQPGRQARSSVGHPPSRSTQTSLERRATAATTPVKSVDARCTPLLARAGTRIRQIWLTAAPILRTHPPTDRRAASRGAVAGPRIGRPTPAPVSTARSPW